jgi:hypothetical protein
VELISRISPRAPKSQSTIDRRCRPIEDRARGGTTTPLPFLSREAIPMKRFPTWAFVVAVIFPVGSARADDPNAIIDKAVTALGGREKLEKLHASEVKTKGILSLGGNESPITGQATVQGLDHYRMQFEGDFGGNKITGMTVINGNKGWRKFGDEVMALDEKAVQGEKRSIYLQLAVGNPTLLKGKGFKVTKAEQGVVTATGPDGKEFTIHFDPQTGLPSKLVATVSGFMGEEVKQETTYSAYKDFNGLKKATKTESKRDGDPFLKQDLVEFKALEKVDAKTFDEPK